MDSYTAQTVLSCLVCGFVFSRLFLPWAAVSFDICPFVSHRRRFCHLLFSVSQQVPEYRNLFLFYKHMKKQLNKLPGRGVLEPAAAVQLQPGMAAPAVSELEGRFTQVRPRHAISKVWQETTNVRFVLWQVLIHQVGALNAFRVEHQDFSSATLARLQDELARQGNSLEERQQVYKRLVDFHGETLLLMHWSILAYTAIVKLLKKHHKHTGLLVQAPQLRDALSQPSWSSEVSPVKEACASCIPFCMHAHVLLMLNLGIAYAVARCWVLWALGPFSALPHCGLHQLTGHKRVCICAG